MTRHFASFLLLPCIAVMLAGANLSAQKPTRKPADVTLTLTGLSTFNGSIKGTCEFDPVEHRVLIDARGTDISVRAFVDYPSTTPFKVAMEGLGGGKDKTVGRVSALMIKSDVYVAGAGSGALDDAAGVSGHIKAEGFIRAGVSMQTQNLTANIAWKCQ